MENCPKTVLCIHDLPCFGRAGLSVIVPVLSAIGVQAIALPTAVLSVHTGGLGSPVRMGDTGFGVSALAQYKALGIRFDCIYTGYLADTAQAKLAMQAIELWPEALAVVDPVMGDNGRMYSGLSGDMVPALYNLCAAADIILPNTTEAALLLGEPLPGTGSTAPSVESAMLQCERLTRICPQVLITGVPDGHSVACVGMMRGSEAEIVRTPLLPRSSHGTGDIFGSVFVGRLLQGNAPQAAVQAAASFVGDCLRATPAATDERLGVWLESVLPRLMRHG